MNLRFLNISLDFHVISHSFPRQFIGVNFKPILCDNLEYFQIDFLFWGGENRPAFMFKKDPL